MRSWKRENQCSWDGNLLSKFPFTAIERTKQVRKGGEGVWQDCV